MALTEEDIKKMSPEELRQLQKQQCIFCHIISKRVQSRIVYEDEQVTATLDINPANPGHVLILPKEHFSIMPQMPDELVAHIAMIAKQMSRAMLTALGAEGTTIMACNGMTAGQRSSHFMMHVIPRKEGDKAGMMLPPGEISEAQLLQIQKQLAPLIAKAFGKEPVQVSEAPQKPEQPKAESAGKKEPTKTPPAQKEPEPPKKTAPQPPDKEPAEDDHDSLIEGPPPEPHENFEGNIPDGDDNGGGSNLDDITSFLLGGKK